MGGVYKLMNTQNSKYYIFSAKNLSKSTLLFSLRNGSHRNVDLQRDFSLLGEREFVIEQIIECESNIEKIKKDYIDSVNSYENLYNSRLSLENRVIVFKDGNNLREFKGFSEASEYLKLDRERIRQILKSTVVPIHLAFKYPVRGYPRLEDKTVWRCCDQIWTPDAITCKIVDTEELLDGVEVKVIDEKRINRDLMNKYRKYYKNKR